MEAIVYGLLCKISSIFTLQRPETCIEYDGRGKFVSTICVTTAAVATRLDRVSADFHLVFIGSGRLFVL
jgi:hypothetical protein